MTPKQTAMKTETICYGDCLGHLKQWIRWNNDIFEGTPALADLIYLDPPWNSKANYNVLFGGGQASDDDAQTAQETAFTDMWQWNPEADRRVNRIILPGDDPEYHDHPAFKSMLALKTLIGKTGMLSYLSYMAERLALLHAMLKDTGSIYLHCDPHASHYLKIVMDNIFGAENFRNEIVWCYGKWSNKANCFQRNTDTILFYGKSENAKFNVLREFSDDKKRKMEKGWVTNTVRSAKSSSGRIRQLIVYDRAKAADAIKKGNYDNIVYTEGEGSPMRNWWTIPHLNSQAKERTGYPTQKPLALLKRIIEASTNEEDVVLDPFCGCGTAVVAARQLKRKFVGIDISLYATETVAWSRLMNEAKMSDKEIRVMGIPADLSQARRLAKDDAFAFEIFAVEACIPGMVANKVQRGDRGIDGKGWILHPVKEKGKKKSLILAQVKAGKPTLSHVRDFAHVIQSTEGAVGGVFITVEKGHWTDGMREVAAQLGTFQHEHSMDEFPKLQHWHIGQFFYESARQRLPHLPELADPYKKEKVPIRQTGFLMKRYGR